MEELIKFNRAESKKENERVATIDNKYKCHSSCQMRDDLFSNDPNDDNIPKQLNKYKRHTIK